jgi:hypothetical protein
MFLKLFSSARIKASPSPDVDVPATQLHKHPSSEAVAAAVSSPVTVLDHSSRSDYRSKWGAS